MIADRASHLHTGQVYSNRLICWVYIKIIQTLGVGFTKFCPLFKSSLPIFPVAKTNKKKRNRRSCNRTNLQINKFLEFLVSISFFLPCFLWKHKGNILWFHELIHRLWGKRTIIHPAAKSKGLSTRSWGGAGWELEHKSTGNMLNPKSGLDGRCFYVFFSHSH